MGKSVVGPACPDCGTALDEGLSVAGLCAHCLLELALEVSSLETALLDPEEMPTLVASDETFAEGEIQGERYRIRSLLGRGGMGEVWRAYDLKLRQDVALKSLLIEMLEDAGALEMLRQEVRVAREVISPNVCRVFDLQEVDGQELVSMEYIDGTTLAEILEERSPLDLDEAREIASQFLAGLDAVHEAGLVHRDVKPENIMITRTGRVVVMDFGIAKALQERQGSLAGTPAYMSPEQARAGEVDARSDIFSAGIVLAEMITPGGVRLSRERKALWEALRRDQPELAESPWSSLIARCIEIEPDKRFGSAAELARALEEVTLRAADENVRPYPGLASFQEEDARFFFGRELEVESLLRKLRRPHLLAVIGPSGAGKSSFLRAGLLPALPEGWRAIVSTPGDRPFGNLAQAVEPEIGGAEGDAELLAHFDEPAAAVELLSEWRQAHDQVLIIFDQFEELFTQSPPEAQERFTELLGRLPLEADVQVLLSMRDDFLFHCHRFEALRPILADLTLLGPPTGASLRRAIVEPALRCGYRFEDDSIVEEMLAEVEGERGALPMVAFSAAQLWEQRDRESGLLTRQGYEQIGGVGGALAQHAEAILDYIGESNIEIVRELFRNLVTAQGMRAVRGREELLSVFPDSEGEPFLEPSRVRPTPVPPPERPAALHVLNALIDARLLTSYEVLDRDEGQEPQQRIEIVHESLLAEWPRLVRWRTQDAEGAQLRDELRGQARIWDQHGRTDDYLWTGAAYLDYLAWRERYPGGLTDIEEAFCTAMTRLAERRRRRRRAALTSAFLVLIAVLGVVGWFWRRSVVAAHQAEAASLYNLARLELEEQPTNVIAYAIGALELADSEEMRRLALEALWQGPTAFRLETGSPYSLDFSPDGRWMVTANETGVGLWPSDGSPSRALEGSEEAMEAFFSADGKLVGATLGEERQRLGVWSWPDGRRLYELDLGNEGLTQGFRFSPDGGRLFTSTELPPGEEGSALLVRSWSMNDGGQHLLGRLPLPESQRFTIPAIDRTGSWLAWPNETEVHVAALQDDGLGPLSAEVLRHDSVVAGQVFNEQGTRLATGARGNLWLWSRNPQTLRFERSLEVPDPGQWRFDLSGGLLGSTAGLVWDLGGPPLAQPLRVTGGAYGVAFDPMSRWVGMGGFRGVSLSPLGRAYPRVLPVGGRPASVCFTPDGERLAFVADGALQVVSLVQDSEGEPRVLQRAEGYFAGMGNVTMSPDGAFVVTGNASGQVRVVPLDGGRPRELRGFTSNILSLGIGPAGRYVAAAGGGYNPEEAFVRVWDLVTDESVVLDAGDGGTGFLKFADAENLLAHSGTTLKRWHLTGEAPEIVEEWALEGADQPDFNVTEISSSLDRALVFNAGRLEIHDLSTGSATGIATSGRRVFVAFFDSLGEAVIWGDGDQIWVSPAEGGEPHLLMGHEGRSVPWAVSPDGLWIASGGTDGTIRLWPMPDLSQTPFHTLPRRELLEKLRALTNLRAVLAPDSPSGYEITVGPFPGWDELPAW